MSQNRYDRFDLGKDLVAWEYEYVNHKPMQRPREMSTGFEISVQLSGRWEHHGSRRGEYLYGPGSVCTIDSAEWYAFSFCADERPGLQIGFILYPDEVPELRCLDGELSLARAPKRDPLLESFCRDFHRVHEGGESIPAPVVRAEIRAYVNRHAELLPRDRLVEARRFTSDHFDRPLYLDHLAEVAGMHPTTFSRRFATRFGATPIHYRLMLRLNAAARLSWCEPTLTVAQLAERVGFTDPSYFHRAFKARFGMTPSQYAVRLRAPAP